MTPIANDLSHLPRAGQGLQPDVLIRFADVLVNAWQAGMDDDKPNAIAGTRFRHSNAGKCARMLGYVAAGIPKSDPMDLSGVMNVSVGTMLHDAWQAALLERYPDAEIEPKVATVGADGSGHIDAVVRDGGHVVAIELKTIGGFGFKNAIGRARKGQQAEGPRTDHILQAALNGLAVDADEVVVVYLAKEALSKNMRVDDERDRFLAEWTFSREQYEPLAVAEADRVARILAIVDGGELPKRVLPHDMPPGAEIVAPSSGRWEVHSADGEVTDTGSVWLCNYCSHQTLCAQTEPGRIPISEVPVWTADPFDGLPDFGDETR